MTEPVIIALVGVLVSPIAVLVTWFLNRKKHIADIYNVLSESSQNAVETMQITMGELRIELSDARQKIEDLITENELLRKDLHALKKQNEQLMRQIHDMRIAMESQISSNESLQHDN